MSAAARGDDPAGELKRNPFAWRVNLWAGARRR